MMKNGGKGEGGPRKDEQWRDDDRNVWGKIVPKNEGKGRG